MPVSFSDCFSDLLCGEDSAALSGDSPEYCYSDLESLACGEDSIAGLIEDEHHFVPGGDYIRRFQSPSLDASAREESVAWILKVRAYYGFQPLTVYLSVNYLDRFLYARRIPEAKGWPWQLLSVACLSLAAKMEEPLVPSLLDLQVEEAKYVFEPRTIQRMEILVLAVLDWRLRSVTPFCFITFFACKLDALGSYVKFLISRSTELILSNIREARFIEFLPSCIAAASILCAANEVPNLSALVHPEDAESWCEGLCKAKIASCYKLMQELGLHSNPSKGIQIIYNGGDKTSESSSSSPSSPWSSSSSLSSSSSSSGSYKRRKLSSSLWVDEDKENS